MLQSLCVRLALVVLVSICGTGCAERPPPPVPNQTAAYWVLKRGGKLAVDVNGESRRVANLSELPRDGFIVREIDLEGIADLPAGGLSELAHLRPLRKLSLRKSGVTNDGLDKLAGLNSLENLDVSATSITDDALPAIGRFTHLKVLDLSGTKVCGSGLKHLQPCWKMTDLRLSDTLLESQYLASLKSFHNLTKLDVAKTSVSDTAVQDLATALKYCPIQR